MSSDEKYASVMLINGRPYSHKKGTFEEAKTDADKMQKKINHRPWGVQDLSTEKIVYQVEQK